jgi:hypothetical protein
MTKMYVNVTLPFLKKELNASQCNIGFCAQNSQKRPKNTLSFGVNNNWIIIINVTFLCCTPPCRFSVSKTFRGVTFFIFHNIFPNITSDMELGGL